MSRWLPLAVAAFLVACGDDDVGVPTDAAVDAATAGGDAAVADAAVDAGPTDPCAVTPGPDLVHTEPVVSDLHGARALASDGTTAIVCGDRFVLAVDLAVGRGGAPVALTDTCRGVAVDGDRAAVTTRDGDIVLLTLSAGPILTEEARVRPGGAFPGALFDGDVLIVAAGAAGLLRFDVSGGGLDPLATWTVAGDARAIVPAGVGRLAVADGALGAALLDAETGVEVGRIESPLYEQLFVDQDAPGGVRDVALPFEVSSIAAGPDLLVAGCGAYGTVRATRAGDELGEALRSPPPFGRPPGVEGVVYDVALAGDDLLYADGLALVRMGLSGGAGLSWIAREPRPGAGGLDGAYWVALDVRGDDVLALSTTALVRVHLEPSVPVPTIDLGRPSVSVHAPPGGSDTVLLQVGNLGPAELSVRIVETDPPDAFTASILSLPGAPGADPDDPSCLRVPAGASVGAIEVRFTATDESPVDGELVLSTADPDRPEVRVPVHGNPAALRPGDGAPAFALPSLDGDLVRLSDLAGDVVLLQFFNYQ